jgi:protein SCO1/2
MTTSPASRSTGLPLAAVLIVALAAGLGLWAGQRWFGASGSTAAGLQSRLASTVLYPEPRALPAFALEGGDGTLDAAALRGRWSLVFLGFTHCPDICPTTLAQLAQAEKLLADLPLERRPRIVFVSADPERDTPAKTTEYARYFSPDALGATADHARLEPFVRSLHMVYAKSEGADGDYSVDHTAYIAVLDAEVRHVGMIRPPLDPKTIAADLRLLTER